MNTSPNVRLPPLSALRAFEAVTRLGSVKDAAAELSLTPSAVSHQLRNLEEFVGQSLLQRRSQQLELTSAGALLAGYTQRGFRELRRGLVALRTDEDASVLRVSVTPLFGTEILVPNLFDFERRHPEVQLRLEMTQSLVDFDVEPVDAAIRIGPEPPSTLYSEVLIHVVNVLVCAPKLLTAKQPLRELDDLKSQALIVQTMESMEHDSWSRWIEATGRPDLKPARELRFDTFAGALQAAEVGVGVLIAPYPMITRHVTEGRLVLPFKVFCTSPWRYRFVCRRGHEHLPKIACFRQWVASLSSRRAASAEVTA
jgi:LysR family glycine cleavage system transcriptional activator